MTVEEFVRSYTEFNMNRRKNQSRLVIVIRDTTLNKNVYGEEIGIGTIYIRPEYKNANIKSWTFDYKDRKIIAFV